MLRKIKRILFPTRHLLKEIRSLIRESNRAQEQLEDIRRQTRDLHARLREIHVEQNKTTHFSNLAVQEHFKNILSTDEVPEDDISFTLQLATRQLDFQIENHDISKPIVCTVALGEAYRAKVAGCLKSQREYCRKNGYAYAELTVPPDVMLRAASWYKISMLYSLLKMGYKDVCYIDADALITNPAIRLEGFFERLTAKKKSLLISVDDSGINMGVFFLRNNSSSLRLLDLIWSYDVDLDNGTWEQNALRELLKSHRVLQKIILIAEQPKDFNSFPPERIHFFSNLNKQVNSWTEGDFICHFSGLRSPDLDKLMAKYVAAQSPA